MFKLGAVAAALCVLVAIPCNADPDFYILADSCKTVVGALYIHNEGVKVVEGDAYIMACERQSKNVTCTTTFKEKKASPNDVTRTYYVKLDYPNMLVITDEANSDYIAANPTSGGAVVITRVINEKIVGSKVCQGTYFTSSEMKDFFK